MSKGKHWPVIPALRILYTCLALPVGVAIVLLQTDVDKIIKPWQYVLSLCLHIFFLLVCSVYTRRQVYCGKVIVDSPLLWKHLLTIIYSSSPLFFNVIIYVALTTKIPDTFSLYLGGLLCIFGGLTAILMIPEVPPNGLTKDYLEKLYAEALQIVWPYIFAFILTLTASPFITQAMAKITTAASLIATICVAMAKITTAASLIATICVGVIGFVSLIVLPLSNLGTLRTAMQRGGFLK